MTLSNADLARRFRDGKTSGSSSNMEIRTLEINEEFRGMIVVDYSWAVLAHRTPKGEKKTLFSDWYGYSTSTSAHINELDPHCNNEIGGIRPIIGRRWKEEEGKGYKDIKTWDNFPFDTELEREVYEKRK